MFIDRWPLKYTLECVFCYISDHKFKKNSHWSCWKSCELSACPDTEEWMIVVILRLEAFNWQRKASQKKEKKINVATTFKNWEVVIFPIFIFEFRYALKYQEEQSKVSACYVMGIRGLTVMVNNWWLSESVFLKWRLTVNKLLVMRGSGENEDKRYKYTKSKKNWNYKCLPGDYKTEKRNYAYRKKSEKNSLQLWSTELQCFIMKISRGKLTKTLLRG